MPITIEQLIEEINPEETVLFFGAGSSMPSFAPSGAKLTSILANKFSLPNDYSLRELSSLIEHKRSRKDLIGELRSLIQDLKPSGGLLNLPLYNWRTLYTTNYDTLIEQSYAFHRQNLNVYTTNFDFRIHNNSDPLKLFKVHGTIEKDISDGSPSRIIITDQDYDQTEDYRQHIWSRFRDDISTSHVIVIGYSLADPHIKETIESVAKLNNVSGAGKTTLLLYTADNDRASLYEMRGIRVCFGGIDEFTAALSKKKLKTRTEEHSREDFFHENSELRPVTIEVNHQMLADSDAGAMFNGWPATYADIEAGLTFERDIVETAVNSLIAAEKIFCIIIGASGVGKTTAARQITLNFRSKGYHCWEHKTDLSLDVNAWLNVGKTLKSADQKACLMVDEAHTHLQGMNELIDRLIANEIKSLVVVCASARNLWNPRVKSPNIYKSGFELSLSRLSVNEIEKLLNLIDRTPAFVRLTEANFSGFNRTERKRRLIDRCEADMFVCLKNIFASEKFDDIILREYAALPEELQNIYKLVAAMENSGIRVHRQLVIRLLGIPAITIQALLINLTDIISEYNISAREGIFVWRGRHSVIVKIISKYKFSDTNKLFDLFSNVIDCISPTYEIEIRTIRELCNVDSGLQMIPDKNTQNTLLRKMISTAPGERVPRHRLIRNLIDLGHYEKAETEIRIFDNDFNSDGAVMRYKISLLTARAVHTPGIMEEDRLTILREACDIAKIALNKFPGHKYVHAAHCELGIEYYKRTKDYTVFDFALEELKKSESKAGDPELSKLISRYERQIAGQLNFEASIDDGNL
jgi:GTPase SAR1 family protein